MTVALPLIEGFFAAVLACGVMSSLYNRFLAGMRESYLKKASSLIILPGSVLLGAAHVVVVITGAPHIPGLAWLGAPVFLYALWQLRQEQRLNGSIHKEPLPLANDGVNIRRFPPPLRPLFHLAAPINSATRPELVQITLPLPNLHRDLEGYRLLFLTDFHVHPSLADDYFQNFARWAAERDPDALLLGGDFVSRWWNRSEAPRLLAPLAKCRRVAAVRGNHDFWTSASYFARMLRRWDAQLLTNDWTWLERGAGRIALLGVEDPYIPLTPSREAELRRELDATRAGGPLLGLVHTPETYRIAARLGCDFALAGHTHGGQIRLPIFGSTIASSTMARQYVWGAGRLGAMGTFTSNGVGCFFPLRVLCPPQAVELVLAAGD